MRQLNFESIKQYIEFDERSSEYLLKLHPKAQPHFNAIIDDFYDAIQRHPDAHRAITGGDAQIQRLKRTLVAWLESVLLGPHDAAYVASHARIGRVHVRISLPQEFMFTAMNRIRSALCQLVLVEFSDEPNIQANILLALNQILDLELALMLDTYREDLMDRMRAQERLATIGQLAASIGHELRNPLGIIESSLYLLRTRVERLTAQDPRVEKHLGRIGAQVQVCNSTITHLLELARSRPPDKSWASLLKLVQAAIDNTVIGTQVKTTLNIPEDLKVLADPVQLRQVFANLFLNAMQAKEDCQITVSAQELPGGVWVDIVDDGPGIPTELSSRIFDALYTTRPKGTGLGLSLCRRILEAHQGELHLAQNPEPPQRPSGAHFKLWLPDHDPPQTEAQ